jgi:hypothetical protein
MKDDEKIITKAISMCFKPYLKPEEAYIYTNLEHTRFAKKCEEFGLYKNAAGYFSRESLDKMMSGAPSIISEKIKKMKL